MRLSTVAYGAEVSHDATIDTKVSCSSCLRGWCSRRSDEGRCGPSEVAAEDGARVGAEPAVDDAGVHGPEVGLVADVVAAVLERGVGGIGPKRRGGTVEAPVHAAAERQHQRRGAVVGALAAI